MTLKRIWVENYREFRNTFENDKESEFVLKNLEKEAYTQLLAGHIDIVLSAAYDVWGDALFDIKSFKVLPDNSVIINVKYTGTVK